MSVTLDQGKYVPRIELVLPIPYLAFKILVQIPREHTSISQALRRILSAGSKTNLFWPFLVRWRQICLGQETSGHSCPQEAF